MLKQIIFILKSSEQGFRALPAEDIDCVRQHLQKYQVTIKAFYTDSYQINEEDIPHTLYLADSEDALDRLQGEGGYGVALMHSGNCNEIFHKALYALDEIREIEYDYFLKAYQRLAGLPWLIADTRRLTIRETEVSDVEEFYRIYREPSITRYMEGLYPDMKEEKVYVEDYIKKVYSFYGYGIWTVVLRETGEVIGRAGLSWREGYLYPELGFVIAKEHQRQGYAEEACREILIFAKKELEFDSAQVLVLPENEPSINLCRKLGFECHGIVLVKEKEHLLLIKRLSCLF